ncbi:cell division protein FtsW [Photobacterium phosphoreum]|jgi:cell division protein FtsW|uniref:Probable peptidoglycan glycosyltransferase FtsW n=1 Tax=Photobacterium phosphoreum TaxID=659 RepID=A0AAW5A3P9_PHOPO|nr:cell division protein FtsW [Photobacterium phosphoreum]KJF87703.1 cell division protein FtsW [Photobacterium phosphoreum]MCD9464310.1 cell division protein FtsW [Photobacterium phosphoreum]MCD9472287.1 cell division protein FtsW [Photobacterium phosphoreum]MCD9479872.1 cell division protein FtsW [Photobacterium phosphoreum]MCD9484297.1 cell division protein FtsW [Photobacterium phosphoreum]
MFKMARNGLSVISGWFLKPAKPILYDRQLVWIAIALMITGLVMVTSASIPVATRLTGMPFFFALRHAFFLACSLVIAAIVMRIPLSKWEKYSVPMLLISIFLLIVVLAIGHSVNGAARWIPLGVFNLQPAEVAKLSLFVFLAGYLVRKNNEVRDNVVGFLKPLGVLGIMGFLLLQQPDLGSFVVMFVGTIGMLFIAGARLWQFLVMLAAAFVGIAMLIIFEPYRLRRVTSFLNPWQDPYGSGYQLTQSLMAFGRGEWFGQGLGNSIQKLAYLPEAHTDFVFAVLAEELGLIGVIIVLTLLFALVFKAIIIGRKCLEGGLLFGGYLAIGFGIWFAFQTLVNVGAAAGIVPTKGLTLPLISYGGSSLFIMAAAVAILIRIDFEQRVAAKFSSEHPADVDDEALDNMDVAVEQVGLGSQVLATAANLQLEQDKKHSNDKQ